MTDQSGAAVADAILSCLDSPNEWQQQTGVEEILDLSAKTIFFDSGALAPIGPIITASLVQLAALQNLKMPTERLLAAWEGAVQDSCDSYARAPSEWKQNDVTVFEADVARCIGVDDHLVHDLIVAFHLMPEGSRIGVLMTLEESTPFRWISAEIDAFDRKIDLEAPQKAVRRLLRSVLDSQEE